MLNIRQQYLRHQNMITKYIVQNSTRKLVIQIKNIQYLKNLIGHQVMKGQIHPLISLLDQFRQRYQIKKPKSQLLLQKIIIFRQN